MFVLAKQPCKWAYFGHLLADVLLYRLLLAGGTDHVAEHQHAGYLHGLEEAYCVECQEVRVNVPLEHRLTLCSQTCSHSALSHQGCTLYVHCPPLELFLSQSSEAGLCVFGPLVLKEAVGESVASDHRLKSFQLAQSRQKIDHFVLFAIRRQGCEAEFIKPVLYMPIEAAYIKSGRRDDLWNGPASEGALHVERPFSLSGKGRT